MRKHIAAACALLAISTAACNGGSSLSNGYAPVAQATHRATPTPSPKPTAKPTASPSAKPSASPSGSPYPCNNAQFLTDQQEFGEGKISADQPVDVCGTVTQVLPSKTTSSGLHGYFYLQVASGETIEIVCDLGQMDAPAWPSWLAVGDYAYVQGRYYYDNASSQGIDWTHHGTDSDWSHPGYVVMNGTLYQ